MYVGQISFQEASINGTRCFGHGGGAPGMNGELKICPAPGYVVAVLSNLDPPARLELRTSSLIGCQSSEDHQRSSLIPANFQVRKEDAFPPLSSEKQLKDLGRAGTGSPFLT